jgi:hypothetical protein
MQEGYDGLLRDKTRPSRIPPLGSNIIERVVTLTQADPPSSSRSMRKARSRRSIALSPACR